MIDKKTIDDAHAEAILVDNLRNVRNRAVKDMKILINGIQKVIDSVKEREIKLKEACNERDRYKELTEWFLNLAMGCGKAGGKPESGEWEICIEQAKQVLKEADDEQ